MEEKQVLLTKQGILELEERLEYLRVERRKEISEQIKEARAFGDLSENAEYDEAKNEQARIEGEIATLEKMLRNAVVVDDSEVDIATIGIGTKIKLKDMELKTTGNYQIVGSVESDISSGKISNEAPMGKALMGKSKGDVVEVEAPVGIIKFKVMDVYK